MRENVVPYVTSLVFVAATSLVIAGYGIYRSFFIKKTDYSYYEEGQPGQPGATTLVEGHEMTDIDDGNGVGYGQASFDQGTESIPQASVMTEQTQEGTKVIPDRKPFCSVIPITKSLQYLKQSVDKQAIY